MADTTTTTAAAAEVAFSFTGSIPILAASLAAVVVGGVVTLAFVSNLISGVYHALQHSGNKKEQQGVGEESSAGKKKKKKKKKKSAKTETEETTASVVVTPEKAAKKKKKKKAKTTAAAATASGSSSSSQPPKEEAAAAAPKVEEHKAVSQPTKPPRKKQQQPPTAVDDGGDEWVSVKGAAKRNRRNPNQLKKKPAGAQEGGSGFTESVVIDAKKVGIIIGPKGATMKAVEEATGCKLDVRAPDRDAPVKYGQKQTATVLLQGGDTKTAKKAVLELANKGFATILEQQQSSTFGESYVQVHPRHLSELVGPGGKIIQAIQKGLNVKLTIPPTDWKPNAPQIGKVQLAKVGIAGSKSDSAKAKKVVESLVQWHYSELTHPGQIHQFVFVPREFFHCIIGSRGAELRHIRGNFKVEVHMPQAESNGDDPVLVVGRKTNVDKAIAYIHTLMDRDADQREQKYSDDMYD